MNSALRVIALMVVAEILAMLGSSAVAATLPTLIAAWHLGPAGAGWLSGAYFFGYVAAVPILVTLTDRIDARLVFALGCAIGTLATFGFAALARDLASATVFWALAGVSLAGVYMPGLRVILDRIPATQRLRAVPYYTASFGIGISLSFLVAGSVTPGGGWRAAFVAGGAGCMAALLALAAATAGMHRSAAAAPSARTLDVSAVFRNAAALRYICAYGGHCWELFALRAWLVALLFFAWNASARGDPHPAVTLWSTVIAAAGVPASIVGAECALRFGRRRLILGATTAAVVLALGIGAFATQAFLACALALLVYTVAVLGDSGAITAGLVDVAPPQAQGATLALHSLVGFLGAALGPIAVGIALALAGGAASRAGWSAGLAAMAAGSAFAAGVIGLRRQPSLEGAGSGEPKGARP